MMYKITITNAATYTIKDAATEEEAILQALDLFNDKLPSIKVEKMRPCQVDGNCPYEPGSMTCTACGKENN